MSGAQEDPARRRRAERLRDARRALIVEAARAVFDRVGLDGATLRVVAREAGCTTGAIYPYFDGKEAIYAAVLGESLETLAARIAEADAAAERSGARADDRVAAGVLAFYDHYAERPAELTLGLYLLDHDAPKRLGAELDRALNRQLQTALAPIERALSAGGAADPEPALASRIAQAVGLLILERTGRLRLWRQSGRALLETALRAGAAAAPPT